jgi:hypothetical protein
MMRSSLAPVCLAPFCLCPNSATRAFSRVEIRKALKKTPCPKTPCRATPYRETPCRETPCRETPCRLRSSRLGSTAGAAERPRQPAACCTRATEAAVHTRGVMGQPTRTARLIISEAYRLYTDSEAYVSGTISDPVLCESPILRRPPSCPPRPLRGAEDGDVSPLVDFTDLR